ncbi:Arabinanase/levansucrase/invertase [Testicularia cyperi]|uniref:Arabinanase/levansucrase/invertase n=1 Tax=Testicularia cyperi TaxID=1882483 RepID=A0A317XW43_9BASI|nr:Arabinanase/levansucrase/invertase [Testicularia cyperi]
MKTTSLFQTLLSSVVLAFGLAALVAPAVQAAEKYVVSGDRWRDTSGNLINAHGAGLLKDGNTWYWVGEYKGANNGFQGFSLYSSTDLINWSSHGLIVPPSSSLPFGVGERPKLIKNPKTGEYVLWFHADSTNYSLAKVGVCYASSVTGPYTCPANGVFSPLGKESRDMNVYVDPTDNQGYLLFATNGNADAAIAKMTSDYKNVTSQVSVINQRLEGFGVFRDKAGLYNMVVSYQSGWQPNSNTLWTSSNIGTTAFSYSNDISPTNTNTYNSQNTFEISPNDNLEVYVGDRWWVTDLAQSTYVWYPLVNRNLVHAPLWRPASSGSGYEVPRNKTIAFSPSTTTLSGSQAKYASCSACPSGQIATYVGNGNSVTLHNVATPSGNAGNVWISVYYSNQNAYPSWRFGSVSVNGGSAKDITYPTGGNPNGPLQDTPVKVSLKAGNNDITFAAPSSDASAYAADLSHVIVWQSDS